MSRPSPSRSTPVLTHGAPEAPLAAPLRARAAGAPRPPARPREAPPARAPRPTRGPRSARHTGLARASAPAANLPEPLGFARRSCFTCLAHGPQRHEPFVHRKNKTGSYFASKVGLLGNSGEVFGTSELRRNHRQVHETKNRNSSSERRRREPARAALKEESIGRREVGMVFMGWAMGGRKWLFSS